MGRVKEYLPGPDDYKAQDNGEEPDELEMLAIDADMARERYEAARFKTAEGQQGRKMP